MVVILLRDQFGFNNMMQALQIIASVCMVGYGLVQGHAWHDISQSDLPYYDTGYYSKYGQIPLTGLVKPEEKARCVESFYCGLKKVGHSETEQCVSPGMVCNGMRDCLNGADERGCPPQCPNGVLCNDRKTCGKPCDGKRDCPGGEDEHCPKSCYCGEGTFKCLNEELCIPTKKACDGHKDCLHGNDEEDCPPACLCKEGSYLCKDGKTCIDADKFCDGTKHCEDEDDETNCPATCFCEKGQYICQVFGEEDPTCITQSEFCDNENDCPRQDDEEDATHCGDI